MRVWIAGSEGPSHDFELIAAPRVGERVTITCNGQQQEGVVTSVNWQLQALEPQAGELSLQGEASGSVSLVHVVCSPRAQILDIADAVAEEPVDAVA